MNILYTDEFKSDIKRIKSRDIRLKIKRVVAKIKDNPLVGKPLRHIHKGKRRVHIGSYVLMYSINGETIYLRSFQHHDKAY
jgi:mRNA interferase RelE/StbE